MKKAKYFLIFYVLNLLTFTSFSQSITLGLVGDYPFSGNALDYTSYGNNCVLHGATPTTGRNGQPNTAYQLNGTSDYIEVLDQPSLDLNTDMTLNIVFMLEDFTNNPCQSNTLIQKWDSASANGYCFQISDNGLDFNCNSKDTNIQVLYCIVGNSTSNINLNYGQFIHSYTWYCATYTLTANVEKIYIDGNLVKTDSIFTPTGINTKSLFFGLNTNGLPAFKGKIDDIKLYNRALSDIEVANLCSQTATTIAEYNSDANIIISPNPSKGIFTFNSLGLKGNLNCLVYDSFGRLLQELNFNNEINNTIDLSKEMNGVYFVKVVSDKNNLVKKIIKN